MRNHPHAPHARPTDERNGAPPHEGGASRPPHRGGRHEQHTSRLNISCLARPRPAHYRGGEIETWGLSVRHDAGRFSKNGGHHAIPVKNCYSKVIVSESLEIF